MADDAASSDGSAPGVVAGKVSPAATPSGRKPNRELETRIAELEDQLGEEKTKRESLETNVGKFLGLRKTEKDPVKKGLLTQFAEWLES